MNKYDGLLKNISEQYGILKGERETLDEWKARILYSLLGQMGYASVWDIQNDLQPATIEHFKRRIQKVLDSYLDMYPELQPIFFSEDSSHEKLITEIYDTFLRAGVLYHTPHRIVAALSSTASFQNICYIRGQALNTRIQISGLGAYVTEKNDMGSADAVKQMFQISGIHLKEIWETLVSHAVWSSVQVQAEKEFLRMRPPFHHGYWQSDADRTGKISLVRMGQPGGQLYYLYRMAEQQIVFSPLPKWMVEEYQYRVLSNACLFCNGTLPATLYQLDGEIVHLHLHYLFPPAELNFISLYSWPTTYNKFPCSFHRIMTKDVFKNIKEIFEEIGYKFEEG